MDTDKVIQILSESLDERDEDENPIKEYEKDKDLDNENLWG